MEKWHFWGERKADGLTFLLGRQARDPAIYRWEPLALPFKGYPAGEFCKDLTRRRQILGACEDQGLLRVLGPVRYENRWWVGWRDFGSCPPFTAPVNQTELTATIRDLLPLIRAYEIVHLSGLSIGMPDWNRLTRSDRGFQLPDPCVTQYLVAADGKKAPSGLTTIYPPEASRGTWLSQTSDRFYLGLLLYCLIGGKIPYPLKNHWPQGIETGRLIPLTHRQPQINPALSALIANLMTVEPEERPLVREVRLQWQNHLSQATYLASGRDYTANLQKLHHYNSWLRLNNWLSRLKLPLGGIIVVWLLLFGFARWQNRPDPTAEQVVQKLLAAPLAAVPLIDPVGSIGLSAKLTAEKRRRLDLVTELTNQPYLKIKAIKSLKRSPRRIEFALILEWWTWKQGQWRRTIDRKRLILGKQRRGWKIMPARTISRNKYE
jgi:hypothetical protein